MSAGTGVTHSEFNPSKTEPVHLLQIWILPERMGLPNGYEERHFDAASRTGQLKRIASRDGREGSVRIQQDAELYTALLAAGESVSHALRLGRHAWVQVARGALTLNGNALEAGDGAALSEETRLELRAPQPSEVLVFDLA
jgi:quercetin 2,3-dioxygenase